MADTVFASYTSSPNTRYLRMGSWVLTFVYRVIVLYSVLPSVFALHHMLTLNSRCQKAVTAITV